MCGAVPLCFPPSIKLREPVICRILVCLAPRGDGEGHMDEPINRSPFMENELSLMDELACRFAQDMHPEQRTVSPAKD